MPTAKPKRSAKPAPKPAAKSAARPPAAANGSRPVPRSAVSSATINVKMPGGPGRAYKAVVGHGLIAGSCKELAEACEGRRAALLVVDAGLGPSAVEPMIKRLEAARIRWGVSIVRATEEDKTIATLERVLAEASRLRLERRDCIIGMGGGIVTDIAGLAGALHRRGVAVIQCPTSLLAMVDAAVGGKTAVNVAVQPEANEASSKPRLVKNAIGAFHQPAAVVCDVAMLVSLPRRELRCGLAECIKHALIGKALGDAKLWEWTQDAIEGVMRQDTLTLVKLVERNVACKARVVMADERETSDKPDGGRLMLNLGHTFAHAIETLPGLSWRDSTGMAQIGPLKHGEAVGLGLICATTVSEQMKLLKPAGKKDAPVSEQVRAMLSRIGLPTRVRGLPPTSTIIQRMADDKKVAAGKLRIVLPLTGGACKVRDDVPMQAVTAGIEAIREANE